MLLKEIQLQTLHLPELYDFYKEVLELPTAYEDGNITIAAGKSTLIFKQSSVDTNPFYHFAFNIPSNKFEEAFEWVKQKTELLWLKDYKGYVADFVNWNAKSFYFFDPAGNIVELICRFGIMDTIDEKFTSKLIRNISEIGLVFNAENFQTEVNKLLDKYPLLFFDKQPPVPQFKALGDDEGLFIIVPENRVWFSTINTESQIFPITVRFMENNKLYELEM